MITVRFIRDYRGRLTREQFHTGGSQATFHEEVAAALVAEEAAAYVDPVIPADMAAHDAGEGWYDLPAAEPADVPAETPAEPKPRKGKKHR